MSFYKSIGASFKEVQDGDLLCTSHTDINGGYLADEILKPKIYKENRNQIFFIRSCRFLGDKYRGGNVYFTIKPECDCSHCLFNANGSKSCALKTKEDRKQFYDYTRPLIEQYPCILENVHFEEYKM